ncbi:hypothetical protein ACLOJK_038386 [Asimina triloba]
MLGGEQARMVNLGTDRAVEKVQTYRLNDVGTSSGKATVEAVVEQEEEERMITMLGEMADMMRDFPNFIVGPERIWHQQKLTASKSKNLSLSNAAVFFNTVLQKNPSRCHAFSMLPTCCQSRETPSTPAHPSRSSSTISIDKLHEHHI